MKRTFYIIAVLLTLTWILTHFVLHAGRTVHILVVMAVICWLHATITAPAASKKYILMKDEEANAKKQRA
jgi:hypothetical protein